MGLTAHQSEKLEECLDILSNGKRLLLSGSAGVGKTYLVNELIGRLSMKIPSSRKIYCSAPTNKAVAVVKEKVDDRPNLEFTTVHSALKIKKQINYKTGEISFKPYFSEKYPPLKGVSLFIIDETSMLNTELLEYVEIHAKRNNSIVIFIGDKKQLNPVGEEESPVFLGQPHHFDSNDEALDFYNLQTRKSTIVKNLNGTGYIVYVSYPEVELTEIIRQGEGNPIIDLSRNLGVIASKADKRLEDRGYIFSNNLAQVVETLATVNGTDDLKYLAWTNKEVDMINNLVRKRIYGDNPSKVELDETLVFNEPYNEEYYTNQEIKVESVEVKEKDFLYPSGKAKGVFESTTTFNPIKLKYYSVNAKFSEEAQEPIENIIIIHEDSEKDFEKLLKNLGSMCRAKVIDWGDFYKFKESFADMKYNHAITVHKSQGSTYKQSIVNIKNLGLNKNKTERERLLYTAVTRASNLLILYKV